MNKQTISRGRTASRLSPRDEACSTCEMSLAQQAFVMGELRRHRQISICRIMLLVLLLALWELAAHRGWIDSFIFSSPTMIAKCLVTMTKNGSLFLHTGVTLMETLASFAVCTFLSLTCALLLCSSKSMAQILEPFLVLMNSLPKSALAPLLIVWLGNNMKTIIGCSVGGSVRLHSDLVYRIHPDGSCKNNSNLLPGRQLEGCSGKGSASRLSSYAHQQYEGEYRIMPGRGDYRRISQRKGGTWIPDYLRVTDLCHDYGGDFHCSSLYCLDYSLPDHILCGGKGQS